MISEARQAQIMYGALNYLRSLTPIKTGNLRYNATNIESLGEGKWRLYIDENIAPYMKYTEEPWEQKTIKMGNFKKGGIIERMRTWKNPNQGWFQKASDRVAMYISTQLRGTLKREKNNIIKEYLIKNFAGRTFELSDGIEATVNKKDVDKLSNKVDDKRIAQLTEFNEIIKKATFSHTTENVDHNKFSKFRYYKCKVRFKGDDNEIWLNVGFHKHLQDWHIYAITSIK